MFLCHVSLLTGDGVLDLRDVGKVRGVGNAQAAHPVSVSPLLGERQEVSGETERPQGQGLQDVLTSGQGETDPTKLQIYQS